jgi:hypothetical protein
MFTAETTALLAHSPARVAAVVRSLRQLPRWCGGMRPVLPADSVQGGAGEAGARRFDYRVRDGLVVPLLVRTLAPSAAPSPAPSPDGAERVVVHFAEGDGLSLVWTILLRPAPGADADATRLVVRTVLVVDPDGPAAPHRSRIARLVARRAPDDLARLAALLEQRALRERARVGPRRPASCPSCTRS